MNNNLKFSAKTTGLVALFCIAAFIVLGIQMAIFGNDKANILMFNPFISGFLHAGIGHFGWNIAMVFLTLLSSVNSSYNIVKIFWVTFLLSLLYLPISILGVTLPAVGISGTCYFLLARYFFSWEKHKKIGYGIILFLVFCEVITITDISDKVAHGVHIMGAVLGYISLKTKYIEKFFPKFIAEKIAQ